MKPCNTGLCLIFLAGINLCYPTSASQAVERQTITIDGWTVKISDELLDKHKVATDRALELLTHQLQEIVRVVPATAVAELQKVPLWFSPEYPKVQPRAEYHPGAGWLRDNQRDPAMEKGVEFTNVHIFERETKRMPNFALHELAHAYHDRVLSNGFDNIAIQAAFENAKARGLYDLVEQRFGDGRSATVQAYAIKNAMEYFAECSEAFFSTNDFFPFTREQLAKHDPQMFTLLKTLWGEPAESPKPLKIFILAGQSNMEGQGFIAAEPKRNGGKGSLEFLVKNEATAKRFSHLVGDTGQWKTRDDVWISYIERHGPLTVGFGARKELIGPELGFGWVLGDALAEPVLLVKCAWGGKSLAVDFRPPSSGQIPYSLGDKQDAAVAQDTAIVGKYYRETVSLAKAALANVKELVPGSNGSYVIAGFGWHQGWNDRINDKFNAEYESNMANFIRDIRKDLAVPALPFVIAETGMSGPEEKHPRALSLMKAQAAVAEHAEFQGNVAFVGTKEFWRPQEASPSGQGYHWNTNAETYYLIGDAMGEAMKRLLSQH
jgi:Carbohydrate esterase, sialic acid-specific acetylesterase